MKTYTLATLALVLLSFRSPMQAEWVQTNGPYGGYALTFAVSGTNLFAGTLYGVFLSTNNGTSWTAASTGLPPDLSARAFAASGTNLFAGTYSGAGVYRSTNNGTSWTAAGSGLTNNSVSALAVSPNGAGGTNLFAGTDYGGGVFLSTNYGTSWTAASTGLPTNTTVRVRAFAVIGVNLFAGTGDFSGGGGGVFLSTNNGTSWTAANTGLTNTYVFALAPDLSGNLFAGTLGGVWRRPLSEMITSVREIGGGELPGNFELKQNYPNPFNPSTKIQFSIPVGTYGRTSLRVYDLLGREVATLVNEQMESGHHEARFDASGLTSGVYFYRLQTAGFVETKKLMVLR